MVTFPERLKEVRKNNNSTQRQVAEMLGASESQYQLYEYGKHKPNYEYIIKLCRYFNVSADYLLGLTDEPRPLA